jgi:hypothetical protein
MADGLGKPDMLVSISVSYLLVFTRLSVPGSGPFVWAREMRVILVGTCGFCIIVLRLALRVQVNGSPRRVLGRSSVLFGFVANVHVMHIMRCAIVMALRRWPYPRLIGLFLRMCCSPL